MINHRKPARFIVLGASMAEGYAATSVAKRFISVVQSNFNETVCNDSSSCNTTTNAVNVLRETLAHQPETAITLIGGNDIYFGYPPIQWQTNYASLVAQLQAAGVKVKHCLSPPRNTCDLTPLKNWISSNYPAADIIDLWTPMLQGTTQLKSIYDSGDGVHPNDLGHLVIGQIMISNLPPAVRIPPADQNVNAGATVTFSVTATGARPPLTYRWYFNGTNALTDGGPLSGSTNATLTVSNVLGANAGTYAVVVGSAVGNTLSAPASLTVTDPLITQQPAGSTNLEGTTASFVVGAFGTAPAYQWSKDGTLLAGATDLRFSLPSVSLPDAGNYSVSVSNMFGTTNSLAAVLAVVPLPRIQTPLLSGTSLTLTWVSLAGRTYRVQFKQNLDDLSWQDVPPDVTAAGPTASTTTDIGGATQGFYRVLLLP